MNSSYAGQNVDFWNLAKGKGRVSFDRVVRADKHSFEIEQVHQAVLKRRNGKLSVGEPQKEREGQGTQNGENASSESYTVDVLRETWVVSVIHSDATYLLL